ncbi:hypothetical protein N8645_00860 [bacterium]|nr:hypothetical protein [bacterium]
MEDPHSTQNRPSGDPKIQQRRLPPVSSKKTTHSEKSDKNAPEPYPGAEQKHCILKHPKTALNEWGGASSCRDLEQLEKNETLGSDKQLLGQILKNNWGSNSLEYKNKPTSVNLYHASSRNLLLMKKFFFTGSNILVKPLI